MRVRPPTLSSRMRELMGPVMSVMSIGLVMTVGHTQIVAMDYDLVQLFVGPVAAVLSAEVVEYEHGGVPHLVEYLDVAYAAVGLEGVSQVVYELRHEREEHGASLPHTLDGDGHGEVRLSDAGLSEQCEPAVGVGYVVARGFQRGLPG